VVALATAPLSTSSTPAPDKTIELPALEIVVARAVPPDDTVVLAPVPIDVPLATPAAAADDRAAPDGA
jgi:hypothetical protein